MNIAAIALSASIALAPAPAKQGGRQAGQDAKKPTVCRSWTELYGSNGAPVGVLCTDRKTPKMLTSYTLVTFEGAAYAVGF